MKWAWFQPPFPPPQSSRKWWESSLAVGKKQNFQLKGFILKSQMKIFLTNLPEKSIAARRGIANHILVAEGLT